ncbi:hypothetical protein JIG36_25585 [Actinoplanes sp. LDG1-06]|uniref:Uncharacterized protein n=1 Tax=Paractinoplanes ovalisporus TaxID=2810368 RepID=A0ABS2AI94_9ACTN|nr:hypothetical protein [Actinoplanes ovalisporus]MBM2618936.1 hypothetical protein [Actinoplanes ovalisporus]
MSSEALLDHLKGLRRTVRHDRQAYAVPLLLFGVLTLAAAPLYLDSEGPDALRAAQQNPALAGLGGDLLQNSAAIGWYWLAALILGYLGTLWWYRRHALAVGVQTSTRKYLQAGVAGVLGGLALGPVLQFLAVNTYTSVSEAARRILFPLYALLSLGLIPILVITIGVLVLARVERSRLLALTAGILAVTLAAAVIYVNAPPFGDTFPRWGYVLTVLPPAAVLLTTGIIAAVRTRRTHT